ncbi:MAG: hypothetical protein ACQETE_00215 [Bacteroidota bacterium]
MKNRFVSILKAGAIVLAVFGAVGLSIGPTIPEAYAGDCNVKMGEPKMFWCGSSDQVCKVKGDGVACEKILKQILK